MGNDGEDLKRIGQVALKGFFRIAEEWGINASEQRILLGDIPRNTYTKYKALPEVKLSSDMLERISYVLGVYKALQVLFPTREQAAAWIRKKNTAYPFNGNSALALMLNGRVTDLADVRRYIDAVAQ